MQVGVARISYALKFARFVIRATHARVQSRVLVSVFGRDPRVVGGARKLTQQLRAARDTTEAPWQRRRGRGIARCNKEVNYWMGSGCLVLLRCHTLKLPRLHLAGVLYNLVFHSVTRRIFHNMTPLNGLKNGAVSPGT